MAVFSEGRWGQPERNNFEVGGHGGIPRLNLQFYRMAVFYEEPGMYGHTSPGKFDSSPCFSFYMFSLGDNEPGMGC